MNKNTALIAVAAAVAFFGWSAGRKGGASSDLAHQAFVTYEAEWRRVNGEAADRLKAREFVDEKQARDWIESQQKPIRTKSLRPVAAFEQEQLGNGQWTAEKHEAILRGWANGQ